MLSLLGCVTSTLETIWERPAGCGSNLAMDGGSLRGWRRFNQIGYWGNGLRAENTGSHEYATYTASYVLHGTHALVHACPVVHRPALARPLALVVDSLHAGLVLGPLRTASAVALLLKLGLGINRVRLRRKDTIQTQLMRARWRARTIKCGDEHGTRIGLVSTINSIAYNMGKRLLETRTPGAACARRIGPQHAVSACKCYTAQKGTAAQSADEDHAK